MRNTPLLQSEDKILGRKQKSEMRRNVINPKSLPKLKEDDRKGMERDLSLKKLISEQLDSVQFRSAKRGDIFRNPVVPKSVSGSVHVKKKFDLH